MSFKEIEDEILPVLVLQFPRAFFPRGKSCRPLRIGIGDELDAALPVGIDRKRLRVYLGFYTKLTWYLRELTPGATRIDLNGAPAGTVSEEDALNARRILEDRWNRNQQPVQPRNYLNPALTAPRAVPEPIERSMQICGDLLIEAAPQPEPVPEPSQPAVEPDAITLNGTAAEAKKIAASANLAAALAAKKAADAKRKAQIGKHR
jgi:ProP effector